MVPNSGEVIVETASSLNDTQKRLGSPSLKGRSPQIQTTSNVLTHGFVHGHIHNHKDHTHIHGHIHNHDHHTTGVTGDSFSSLNADSPIIGETDTDEIDKILASCCQLDNCFDLPDDLECDFLTNCDSVPADQCFNNCNITNDDCFETPCGEGNSSSKTIGPCTDPNCLEDSNVCTSSDCAENCCVPSDTSNKIICEDSSCCDTIPHHSHATSTYELGRDICDTQNLSKPLLESLINNVYKMYETSSPSDYYIDDKEFVSEKQTTGIKREKEYVLPSHSKRAKPSNAAKGPLQLDIHFPHMCHSSIAEAPNSHHNIHQSCFFTTIPNNATSSSTNFKNSPSDSQTNSETPPYLPNNYKFNIEFNNFKPQNNLDLMTVCKWDNCSNEIYSRELKEHIVKDHILDHNIPKLTNLADLSQEVYELNNNYNCEWNECDFKATDLKNLINHINDHKDYDDSILSYNKQDSLVDNSFPSPLSIMGSTKMEETRVKNEVNITSINIKPSTVEEEEDPEHRCLWEITDNDGNVVSVCNQTHKDAGDLTDHLINDHIGAGKSIYHCHWASCSRGDRPFSQRQKIIRHLHVHTKYKPFKCHICGSHFAVDSMLVQHLRIHSGEKPFSCRKCGKTFATSSSLSIHNRIHTGEKPLECKHPGCGKRFSESSNLTKHMKIHAKEFKCEHCDAVFDKKSKLTNHMKDH